MSWMAMTRGVAARRRHHAARRLSYAQINRGASHAFHLSGGKPLTIGADVIDVFDGI